MQKLGYQKLEPTRSASTRTKLTSQQRYWKRLHTHVLQQSINPVTCVSSNHNVNKLLVFAHWRTVTIMDASKKAIVKEISSFNDALSAICVRADSTVLACGDQAGVIQVMDTKEKFHLRTFNNHKKRVACLDYVSNDLYSCGDDLVIRHFDVAAGSIVHSYEDAHEDYIRCVKVLQDNHVLSGGYDNVMRLFDFRVHEKAQLVFNHGEQVEWMDTFPSGMMFVGCGGNKVTLWDIRSEKCLMTASNHKKIVSCVRVVSEGSRFMTASYDTYFKIYKSDTFELTYQQKMPGQIFHFDVTADSQAVGLAVEGGKMMLKERRTHAGQQRQSETQSQQVEDEILKWINKNESNVFAYNDKYFYRGVYDTPSGYDLKLESPEIKKVSQYDRLLKKYHYKEALLLALRKKNMMIYLSLVDEYVQRGCLERTLLALSESEIDELLLLLSPLLRNHKYSKPTLYLLDKMAELVGHRQANWEVLSEQLEQQMVSLQELTRLDGMLQFVQNSLL